MKQHMFTLTLQCFDFLHSGIDCGEDCADVPDGDYQSCRGCNAYLTCADGVMHDDRLCPGGLVWDDVRKYCDWFSHTCREGMEPVYEDDAIDDKVPSPNQQSNNHFSRLENKPRIIQFTSEREENTEEIIELTPLQKLLLRGPI